MSRFCVFFRFKLISILVTFLFLTACGTAEDDSGQSTVQSVNTTSVLYGSVGDGPILGATVKVYDKNGDLILEQTSDSTAKYELTVNAKGKSYPLTLETSDGQDLVSGGSPDFTLKSVSLSPGKKKRININPFSTLIVEMASKMPGGITSNNTQTAKQIVLQQMNFGLDQSLIPDPISSEINETNIASIIRSSEALGEMIRRTRDALKQFDSTITGDQVISLLADDLLDGVLDGLGSPGADARTAAISNILSAQVMIEIITGKLNVNNSNATSAMDNALLICWPTVSPATSVNDLPTVGEILDQSSLLLQAAETFDPETVYETTINTLSTIPAGSQPELISSALPATVSSSLSNTLAILLASSETGFEQINSVVRLGAELPLNTNTAPTISGIPVENIMEGYFYSFVPTASDADGDSLSFSISNLPAWASFNTVNGAISGTPDSADVGTTSGIVITVSDGVDSASLPAFSITVSSIPNTPPTISGSPASSVTEGVAYSFVPTASDVDGDSLSFSISNLPAWASFNTANGAISGTPDSADVGTTSGIVITVSDGVDGASLPTFSITVSSIPNTPPTISGSPASSVTEGVAYSFVPTASDVDGDSLSFSISNLPAWASFNTANGAISGTPDSADIGTTDGIVITVSDGVDGASLPAFPITVSSIPNTPPTINGSPASSVTEGVAYNFVPTASDADGDSLSFSISNLPAWASFNDANGAISGTPDSADVGTTDGIVITVSDGVDNVSLPSFSITVETAIVNFGSATLSWVPPTQNNDGSALTDLAGYKIYYGTSSGNYSSQITINNPGISSYVVDNLPGGNTYYFVITAVTTSGIEGELSNEGSKTIP